MLMRHCYATVNIRLWSEQNKYSSVLIVNKPWRKHVFYFLLFFKGEYAFTLPFLHLMGSH